MDTAGLPHWLTSSTNWNEHHLGQDVLVILCFSCLHACRLVKSCWIFGAADWRCQQAQAALLECNS